ncbi:MAG: hypothetical protein LPJ95_08215 [Paracoccaceae bacterium]|nr:hypothetical protein [Paracoccaceae bacterium]
MVYSQISALMLHRGELLLTGRTEELLATYRFPLPVYLRTVRFTLATPERARPVFAVLRQSLLDRGVTALAPRITALDLPRGGRFRVWVDWNEVASCDQPVRLSSATYYCREMPSGPVIEMVNFTRVSMPGLKPQFAALARSA